jgi:broad specificity phosphatase PhoE
MAESQRFSHFSHPNSGTSRMVLVRHGQTAANADQLMMGRTDHSLNELGLLQAERAASRIREQFEVDAIVSSPLKRASATASVIGRLFGLEHDVEDDLQEMDFGDFEGMSVERFLAEHLEFAVKAFDPSDNDLAWPNGESRSAFHRRVHVVFTHLSQKYESQTVVVVSHGGVLGSFLAQVQGRSPNDWQGYRLANCSISWVEIVPDGTIVHAFNDCDHLDGLISMLQVSPEPAP